MDPSAGREQQLKYGGFAVAGVGFLLSRVTLLVVADPASSFFGFLTTGFVPLVAGLALTAFGVSLAVSTFEPWYVNVVAAWTILGTAGMGLVAALSVVNPMLARDAMLATTQSSTLVANTLIGGAVGGTLIGVRSARTRRQRRTLARQSDQVVVLDRILRDEVLNALTAIRGRAELLADVGPDSESVAAIRRGTDRPTASTPQSRTSAFSSSPGTRTVRARHRPRSSPSFANNCVPSPTSTPTRSSSGTSTSTRRSKSVRTSASVPSLPTSVRPPSSATPGRTHRSTWRCVQARPTRP